MFNVFQADGWLLGTGTLVLFAAVAAILLVFVVVAVELIVVVLEELTVVVSERVFLD